MVPLVALVALAATMQIALLVALMAEAVQFQVLAVAALSESFGLLLA
jgi:hypothetical protein